MAFQFENGIVSGSASKANHNESNYSNEWFFRCKLMGLELRKTVRVYAARPIERRIGFSGSGLPFPNFHIAMENSPNRYEITLPVVGDFQFRILEPNAFYEGNGFQNKLVPPTVFFQFGDGTTTSIPFEKNLHPSTFRTLMYNRPIDASFPTFMDNKISPQPIRSSYDVMMYRQTRF